MKTKGILIIGGVCLAVGFGSGFYTGADMIYTYLLDQNNTKANYIIKELDDIRGDVQVIDKKLKDSGYIKTGNYLHINTQN